MARKEKFDYAGEGALVEDEGVRSACVKAATDLEVFFLSRQGLQECMAAHPSIKTIFANQKAKQELENKVTRIIVAGIWVAFFRECQHDHCCRLGCILPRVTAISNHTTVADRRRSSSGRRRSSC